MVVVPLQIVQGLEWHEVSVVWENPWWNQYLQSQDAYCMNLWLKLYNAERFNAWLMTIVIRSHDNLRNIVITARNEVGARLYFHRRLWFCSRGGGGKSPCQGASLICFTLVLIHKDISDMILWVKEWISSQYAAILQLAYTSQWTLFNLPVVVWFT